MPSPVWPVVLLLSHSEAWHGARPGYIRMRRSNAHSPGRLMIGRAVDGWFASASGRYGRSLIGRGHRHEWSQTRRPRLSVSPARRRELRFLSAPFIPAGHNPACAADAAGLGPGPGAGWPARVPVLLPARRKAVGEGAPPKGLMNSPSAVVPT